ncbi:MAG: PAS domain S-box protein, partial [Dehalococcoidia bacterium]
MAFEDAKADESQPADDLAVFRVLLPGTGEADERGLLENRWFRVGTVIGALIAYAVFFLWLAPTLGQTMAVLAIVPVMVGALMFGARGGVLVGIAVVPSNGVLLNLADPASNGVIVAVSDIPAAATLIFMGGLMGKLRDLAGEVSRRLADQEAANEDIRVLAHQNFLLLNAVGEGVCGIDLAGRVTFANSAAAHMLLRHPVELQGRPFDRVFKGVRMSGTVGPSSVEMVEAALRRGKAAEDQELQLARRDGSSIPVEFHVTPVFDDEDAVTGAVVTFHDITARVRAMSAWKETQEEQRTIVENLSEAISISVGSERVFVNGAFLAVYGLSDYAEALRVPVGGMVIDEDRDQMVHDVLAYRRGEEGPRSTVFRIRRRDGEIRTIESTGVIISYKGDAARLALLRDVTEHREATAAMTSSEVRFRSMFEAAGEGIAILDLGGHFMSANPVFLHKLDYAADELAGRSFREIVHPDEVREMEARWLEMMGGEHRWTHQVRFMDRWGETIWSNVRASVVLSPTGDPEFAFLMVEDITERKAATDALAESEAKLRSLVEHTPNAIMNVTRNGQLLFTNRDMGGMSAEELIGTSVFDLVPAKHHAHLSSALDQVFVTGEPSSYEVKGTLPDGGTGWYAGQVNPVKKDGEVIAATLVSFDVTELKLAQEDAQRGSRELSALFAVSNALSQPGTLEERVSNALEHVADATQADLVVLRATEEDDFRMLGMRVQGTEHERLQDALENHTRFS